MLSFVGSSLVAVWMALADPSGIQGALTWLLGDLSRARTDSALILLGLVVVITLRLLSNARAYDALLMGDETAISVGVNITKVRNEAVFLSSVLTGLSVSGAGMIGFVGLLTPHLVRRLSSSTHRFVFPLSAILGGGILVFSDLLARVIAKPYELPVGVVTSLIGAPLFLFFMLKARARE
jgi:iron complex transport system permease protein